MRPATDAASGGTTMLFWRKWRIAGACLGILGLFCLWDPGGSRGQEPDSGSALRTATFFVG